MEAKIKSLCILLFAILLNSSSAFSQLCADLIPLGGPFRYEAQMPTGYYFYVTNQTPNCPPSNVAGTSNLPGMAVNIAAPATPNYMLDILSNLYVGDGVNVSNGGNNAVGYSIGGALNGAGTALYPQMFAWHSGDTTSAYIGIHAGYSTPKASSAPSYNTYVGNQTGINFAGTGGIWNTAVGYDALLKNTGGVSGSNYYGCKNVAVGDFALESLTSNLTNNGFGNSNTAVGWAALQLFTPNRYSNIAANTALGSMALNRDDTGTRNTAVGYQASYKNKWAVDNVSVGHVALWKDSAGNGNVALGSFALFNNVTSANVAVGYNALTNTISGSNNTGSGYEVMLHNTLGFSNSATGNEAMLTNTQGNMNVADGSSALFTNKIGDSNVAIGNAALFNDTASCNTGTGNRAMWSFIYGRYNTADGYRAMFGGTNAKGDSNSGEGATSLYNITLGHGNSALGYRAGYSVTTDTDNVFIGARSDRGAAAIRNAGAIGYKAVTTVSSQMELGNNSVTNSIGLSSNAPNVGNVTNTNLEIATEFSPWATGWHGQATTPNNYYLGTGTTGLRFKDLNSNSATVDPNSTNFNTTTNPYPQGVLSVDGYGNVIYIKDSSANGGLFGYCTPGPLPTLAGDAGTNLNTHNFYFAGNYQTIPDNNVIIGHGCGFAPRAKLDILQHSDQLSSTGLFVQNADSGTCTNPVYGMKCVVTNPLLNQIKIAGYFDAPGTFNFCCPTTLIHTVPQHAIFVPKNGGDIELGFGNQCGEPYTLDVNGSVWCGILRWVSDSTLKTGVAPITNALNTINQLKGVSFQYVDSMLTDTGMYGTHYGFIAQQVARVLPNAVQTSPTSGLMSLEYTAIIPWTVEAIKQEKKTNDSLRYSLDSLRNAFKYYASCLASLCSDGGDGHSAIHHHGGSGDSNTNNINIQDVTLSAVAGVPLLYQNIPNPFSTGTKINYFLPVNTQGASIVFYDTYGNKIKTVELSQTGNGTLNITPDNLTSGIYSYSLVVNGNVIDTKRMLLQK